MFAAEAELGSGEQPVDHVVVLACTIIDEFSAAFGTEDEQRRHLALANGARELDKDLGAIVEGAQRPPQAVSPSIPTGAADSATAFCRRSAMS
jgi:hypothetical protein